MQLRLDANDTEHRLNALQDELEDEAQLILNQMPLDMVIIKQELEDELRTYGNLVRQYLPTEHRLCTLGSSLMADLRRQTEAYKAEINSFIGPSRNYHNMIPSEARHAERTRLKNEIAMDLHLRIQAETQEQFRTLQRNMNDKLLNFNDVQHLFDPTLDQKVCDTQRLQEQHQLELEAVALCLALTEVEHTKLTDRTEYLEAMATRLAQHRYEDRMSHLETALQNQDTPGGSVPNIEHRLASLDSRTREQDKAIAILEAQARGPRHSPRASTRDR
jgi:hypothetical protein